MKNQNAIAFDTNCRRSLLEISTIKASGPTISATVQHLTCYSAVLCSGVLERSFKIIITDYFASHPSQRAINFINHHIKDGSMNPTYGKILSTLSQFDSKWSQTFEQKVLPSLSKNKGALTSLVNARNDIAHGKSMNSSFETIKKYYEDAWKIIEVLDSVVS